MEAPIVSRRRKLPDLPPGQVRTFSIAVVCTDRGQHPEAGIASLSGAPLPGQDPGLVWQQAEHGEPVTSWMQPDGWRTFRFTCSRCGRDVRLREPNVLAAAAVLPKSGVGDGRPVLDISLL
jgi:hypothetical protein